MSDYTDDYKDLIIKQYWEKPNAVAEIELQSSTWERIFNWLNDFTNQFDVDNAVGSQLDIIGKIVGVNRRVPEVLTKLFFGFDNLSNVTGFDNRAGDGVDLGPFYSKFAKQYTDLELNDFDYRFFIKSKIRQNIAAAVMIDDNLNSIQDAILSLFNNRAYVIDNYNMTLTLGISPTVLEERVRIILRLDLLPKPQSVRYILKEIDLLNTFNFSQNPNAKGFKDLDDPINEPGGYFASLII